MTVAQGPSEAERGYAAATHLEAAYAALGLALPWDTAHRVARWLATFNKPPLRTIDAKSLLSPIFANAHDELILVKDIRFVALCEHHLLPFSGKAAVGYIPNGNGVVGLSKLARLVHAACAAPTLQEDITAAVANAIEMVLQPQGVMVVLYDVMHSCISMRGVMDPEAVTTTSAVRGVFRTVPEARTEFLSLMRDG